MRTVRVEISLQYKGTRIAETLTATPMVDLL